jgi:tRNA dimethylallyltransferase
LFEEYALQSANKIFEKNTMAVMVGGTGLYVKAFCDGIDEMPVVSELIRNEIIEQYKTKGIEWLQNELKEKDPIFWNEAEQQNPQRLMRALEIFNATGKSINSFRQNKKTERSFNIIKVGFELPKEELLYNINQRVDMMMQEGLLKEVESLLPCKSLNALQTVGYKELFEYFDDKCSLSQAVERIKINTRQYAKRQLTWFKKDAAVKWFNAKNVSVESLLQNIAIK